MQSGPSYSSVLIDTITPFLRFIHPELCYSMSPHSFGHLILQLAFMCRKTTPGRTQTHNSAKILDSGHTWDHFSPSPIHVIQQWGGFQQYNIKFDRMIGINVTQSMCLQNFLSLKNLYPFHSCSSFAYFGEVESCFSIYQAFHPLLEGKDSPKWAACNQA